MVTDGEYGQGESITARWRALWLFTNRRSLIRLFTGYLNEDLPPRILFFHGDGGNGKSLLLEYLREFCGKRFKRDYWDLLKKISDDEFMQLVKDAEENVEIIPCAEIDFGSTTASAESYKQAFYGLARLRRQLVPFKFRFPVYEYALFWYSFKTGLLSDSQLKSILPTEELDIGAELLNYFSGTSYGALGKSAINLFGKYVFNQDFKAKFTRFWQKRGVHKKDIEKIERMDAERELINYLPDFFAQDLKAAMKKTDAPTRVVLMFDTHESFWSEKRDKTGATYYSQDEWLRRLLCSLKDEPTVVAIVAGREKPRWAEAPKFSLAANDFEIHLVGHLSHADADEFLRKAESDDDEFRQILASYLEDKKAALRQSLINYTKVRENEVHPFYLGLAVDIVLAAGKQGTKLTAADFAEQPLAEKKEEEVIDRFLWYVNLETENAVYALAASRNFNEEIFIALGNKLNFQSTAAAFEILRGFSFVWRAERRGAGWYQIHDLLRSLLEKNHSEKLKRAHAVLENYHRQKITDGDEIAIAEAIYHANHLDWKRGVNEWTSTFEQSLKYSRYQICRSLLEVRGEMLIDDDFLLGLVSQNEGNFYLSLSDYTLAAQEYNEAIASYDKALQLNPRLVQAHNSKGNVLQSRGDLEDSLSNNDEALESYTQSIESYDKALQLDPHYVKAYNNKGGVLQSRGDLEFKLTRYDEALQSYQAAVESYEKALQLDSRNAAAHNNKGLVLQSRGDLEFKLTHYEPALESYTQSIESYDKALQLDPNAPEAHNNKGLVLQSRGDLETSLTRYNETFQSYQAAVESYEKALGLAPNDPEVRNNKGNVLQSRGLLRISLGEKDEVCRDLAAALVEFSCSLKIAPHNKKVQNRRQTIENLIDEHCREESETSKQT